jgi:secretin/TonB-like protein
MAGRPKARSLGLFYALLIGFAVLGATMCASAETSDMFRFDIPAQPLAGALDTFSAVTGIDVYYDASLAAGVRSAALEGTLRPDDALRSMLTGSGITAQMTSARSLTLRRIAPDLAGADDVQPYFAAVQAKVTRLLCGHANTQPGETDLLFKLWISRLGLIEKIELMQSVPDDRRGSVVSATLRGASLGMPPAGLHSPLVLAVLARNKGDLDICANRGIGSN